ncbi:MAG: hypothetical protein KAU31_02750, partial [Spirochaetaceae bacterium]|nr:hypothetical protein [Spirochaetaceae bacterium]
AIGNSTLLETSGRLSLGTATSDAKLRVENAGGLPVLKLVNTSSGSGFDVLQIQRTQAIAADDALIQMTSATGTDTEALFIECLNSDPSLPAKPFVVRADGSIDAAGPLTIDTDGGMGLSILAQTTGHNDYCLSVGAMATGVNCIAVNGYAAESDAYGIGGWFSGGQTGVKGDVFPTGSSSYFGVSGRCNGGSGTNTAVYGEADGSGTCYGVYGVALGNGISWAGFFSGDVRVTGAINPTLGGFQIDHPLDPANRYLNHSFVESPDMKTVYDGVAVLDASGQATVVLPDYFEALNSELRYQLTPVGGAAPSLHIAEKVAGGRFVIAGGVPGLEVCWQVTGVRRDEAAEAYRIDVEELKLEQERGKYVHPELYGAPEDARIGRIPDTDKTGSE